MSLKIIYDHRVMDGRDVARALNEIERILQGEMLDEVSALRKRVAA